jgi:hypothetical protein
MILAIASAGMLSYPVLMAIPNWKHAKEGEEVRECHHRGKLRPDYFFDIIAITHRSNHPFRTKTKESQYVISFMLQP